MTTAIATGGLLLLALIVASCLWPPQSSRISTLVLALGTIIVVTILSLAIALLIITFTIGAAILLGAGLPIPAWTEAAIDRTRTRLLRSFRHGA
jgi:hypothetical protein